MKNAVTKIEEVSEAILPLEEMIREMEKLVVSPLTPQEALELQKDAILRKTLEIESIFYTLNLKLIRAEAVLMERKKELLEAENIVKTLREIKNILRSRRGILDTAAKMP